MIDLATPRLTLLILAATTAGCSTTARQAATSLSVARVAGCYEIRMFPDDTGSETEAQRAEWSVPPMVVLDTVRLTTWPSLLQRYDSVFVARTVSASGQIQDHPFHYWRVTEGDSIFVGHPGALAGVSLTVAGVGDELVGEMRSFTDVMRDGRPSSQRAPVRLSRGTCPE